MNIAEFEVTRDEVRVQRRWFGFLIVCRGTKNTNNKYHAVVVDCVLNKAQQM